MANIYKAMAPFWVEVLILSPEDTAIFLNSRQDKNGEKWRKNIFAGTDSGYL